MSTQSNPKSRLEHSIRKRREGSPKTATRQPGWPNHWHNVPATYQPLASPANGAITAPPPTVPSGPPPKTTPPLPPGHPTQRTALAVAVQAPATVAASTAATSKPCRTLRRLFKRASPREKQPFTFSTPHPHQTILLSLHAPPRNHPHSRARTMPNSSQLQSARLRTATTGTSAPASPGSAPIAPYPQPNQETPPDTPAASPNVADTTAATSRPLRLRIAPSFNNPRANTPLFGSLTARDATFYCKATVTQLKTIVGSAPRHLRSHLPSNPTKDMLLETVLSFRTEEAVQARLSQRSPAESLQELLNFTADELKALATSSPARLTDLMTAALQADSLLQPRQIPSTTEAMIITPPTGTQPIPSPSADRVPQPEIAAPPNNATNLLSDVGGTEALEEIIAALRERGRPAQPPPPRENDFDEDEEHRSGKKQKIQLVPQGFTFGSTANIDQMLRHYPGKEVSSPALACKELLGPFILVQLIQAGNSIPVFLQEFKHWRKTLNGLPAQTQMEAHTLGRIIHMEMLKHDSPRQALENRPSLEIALRRLFAILYVEEAVNTGKFQERTSAWHYVHLLHESVPLCTVICDHIDDAMTNRMSLRKKRIAAIKAIEEARANRPSYHANPRSRNPRGNWRKDKQERPDRQDRQDRTDRH